MHLGPHLSLPMIEIVANTTQYGKGGITHTFLIKSEHKEDHDYHIHSPCCSRGVGKAAGLRRSELLTLQLGCVRVMERLADRDLRYS